MKNETAFDLKTVLLIDDDEGDNFICKRIVRATNFSKNIEVKTSAVEALEYLRNCAEDSIPQLIFLDLNMPGMNGFEFLSEYDKLKDSIKESIKIVVLANHLTEQHKARLSGNPYVKKSFVKPFEEKYISELKSEI